jgi:hypothetical protein
MLYHPMDNQDEKRITRVTPFKATPTWYAAVKRVAARRRTTIAGAIIYLVELGLPVYERVSEAEGSLVATIVKEIEVQYQSPYGRRGAKKPA